MSLFGRIIRGVAMAIRARPRVFFGVGLGVLVLYVSLPLLVLSVVRKPVDFFTFNPWLSKLPAYLVSAAVPLRKKLDFVPGLVLFWFSADGDFGAPEWGFAVDVSDVTRFLAMAALFGAYFALWLYRRDQAAGTGARLVMGRHGGIAGALTSVLGFSTGPCSVVGCGAPVIPVVGLAFAGLSSGSLKLLAGVSSVAAAAMLLLMLGAVAYLGWRAGGVAAPPIGPGPARTEGAKGS